MLKSAFVQFPWNVYPKNLLMDNLKLPAVVGCPIHWVIFSDEDGRRGTIFIFAIFCLLMVLGSAIAKAWPQLLDEFNPAQALAP